jgi:nicotinate-nucleotide adenylyltransferase
VIRALFGGSFDPVHAGHVAIVDLVLARRLADIVHVVPAWRSPLKEQPCRAPADVRMALVVMALAGRAGVVVEDLEIERRGASYTIDTLSTLIGRHPDDRWRLVIGADQAASFAHWHQPERLLKLAEPLVIARGEPRIAALLSGETLVVSDFDHPASAAAIRKELADGQMPGPDMLPPVVASRIRALGLYGYGELSCRARRRDVP